ncbi:MAG: CAP domain-containing protein [Chloroflexi bacterium]|nr:CAP domain-containing protein [Chloroflexota bacterium]
MIAERLNEILTFILTNSLLFLVMGAIASIVLLPLYLKWLPNRRIVSFRGRLLNQVNHARQRRHIGCLGRTNVLDRVAYGHSRSMAKRRHCDHGGFNGRCSYIERKTGLSRVAENCYMFPARKYNAKVARELVGGWLKSPGHRENLLNPEFKRTGIGIVESRGYVYATQLFTD